MGNFCVPHIAITVADIEKTKKFYRDIGFSVLEDIYSEEKKRNFLLLSGFGLEIEVFSFNEQDGNRIVVPNLENVGFQHFALAVDDLNKIKKELILKGIELTKDISTSSLGVKHINITDPSGFIIEFFERQINKQIV